MGVEVPCRAVAWGAPVLCRAVGWGAPMVCRTLGRSTCVGAYGRAVVGEELSLNLEGVLFTVLPGKKQSSRVGRPGKA